MSVRVELVTRTFAPDNASDATAGVNSSPTPVTVTSPWLPAAPPTKPKLAGAAMDSVEPPGVAMANRAPSASRSSLAVEKCAAAGTLTRAPAPNTIPAGLTKKKLALGRPVESSVPSICEIWLPVTRLITLLTAAAPPAARTHWAVSPPPRLNWAKLWNRFAPDRVPPSMVVKPPLRATVVPSARAGSRSATMVVVT